MWDLDRAVEAETIRAHSQAVLSVCYDPTGKWVVSGSVDRTLRLTNLGSENAAVVVGRHEAAVCCVAFSSSGQYILSGGRDDVACMWDWTVAYATATDDTPDHSSEVFLPDSDPVFPIRQHNHIIPTLEKRPSFPAVPESV